jgi:hypothetical protein
VANGHTVSGRPHLGAEHVINYHHRVCANLRAPHLFSTVPEAEVYGDWIRSANCISL